MAKRAVKRNKSVSAKNVSKRSGQSMILAIVSLIVNILIPGVGSLLAGRTKTGIWQLILVAIGLIIATMVPMLSLLVIIVAEIWGIYTSIKLISAA